MAHRDANRGMGWNMFGLLCLSVKKPRCPKIEKIWNCFQYIFVDRTWDLIKRCLFFQSVRVEPDFKMGFSEYMSLFRPRIMFRASTHRNVHTSKLGLYLEKVQVGTRTPCFMCCKVYVSPRMNFFPRGKDHFLSLKTVGRLSSELPLSPGDFEARWVWDPVQSRKKLEKKLPSNGHHDHCNRLQSAKNLSFMCTLVMIKAYQNLWP